MLADSWFVSQLRNLVNRVRIARRNVKLIESCLVTAFSFLFYLKMLSIFIIGNVICTHPRHTPSMKFGQCNRFHLPALFPLQSVNSVYIVLTHLLHCNIIHISLGKLSVTILQCRCSLLLPFNTFGHFDTQDIIRDSIGRWMYSTQYSAAQAKRTPTCTCAHIHTHTQHTRNTSEHTQIHSHRHNSLQFSSSTAKVYVRIVGSWRWRRWWHTNSIRNKI